MQNDRSVPLSEALQHFSDPNDRQELVSLERYAMQLIILGGPETENERRHRRYHRLKHLLETEVLGKLTAGTLQATGFECPVGLDDERRLIQAAWWEKLDPDFDASEAKGPGGLHLWSCPGLVDSYGLVIRVSALVFLS